MSRRRQPHRIPPPISHGAETLDAEIVLHEFPDEVGLQLWRTVRAVRLWGDLPPAQRPHAFTPDAYDDRVERLRELPIDPDLRESLETAVGVVKGEDVHLEGVVTACRLIASWAESRGALGTALEFTQVAALLMPGDAELVHAVAQVARRREEFARAESWYRQAIAVSRRSHDWISLAGSYLGLGSTFLYRGNHAAARQTLVRGIRAAARHSLWEERALLSHEMARLAMRTERPAEAVRSGRAAFEAYGRGHANLPHLASELGVHWVRAGFPTDGRRVLLAIDPRQLEPTQRLDRSAALARAAGVEGDPAALDAFWREAEEALQGASGAEAARAWIDLAIGALAAGDSQRARSAVERARREGEVTANPTLIQEVDVLERLAGSDTPPPQSRRKTPRELRSLANELVTAFSSSAEAA
jgi:tetratricopeptide (TPR) repeat protein